MAEANFNAVMDEIFRHEGGLSMIRSDPGNWTGGKVGVGELRGTNFGIASHAHPTVDIQNLTKAQAREIYRKQYWNPIWGDRLPHGIDLVTMDPAVNSGVSRGVRWLQTGLGFKSKMLDGRMGPMTLQAANEADSVPTIKRACEVRMGFLRGLKTFTTFGRGWSRRVAEVEAKAVAMALSVATPKQVRTGLLNEKDHAAIKSNSEQTAATGSGAAGGLGAAGGGTMDIPIWVILIVVGLFGLVTLNLFGKARHDRQRAEAYEKAAIEVGP